MIIEYNIPSPVDVKALNIFVRALCAYDVLWLKRHPETPDLYKSGVRYKSQPAGCEHFAPIPLVLAAGSGDCDQLAPWRCAELRVRHGVKAMPEVKQMGPALFHVFCRLPGGKVEDVSARLGMDVPPKLAQVGRAILRKKAQHVRGVRPSPARASVLWPASFW